MVFFKLTKRLGQLSGGGQSHWDVRVRKKHFHTSRLRRCRLGQHRRCHSTQKIMWDMGYGSRQPHHGSNGILGIKMWVRAVWRREATCHS